MTDKFNGGVHMERGTLQNEGKGSRRRRGAPPITQDKWDSIFKNKEKKEPKKDAK